MKVYEYEAKFKDLPYFDVDLYRTNETRKCNMFDNGIRDEIKTSMSTSLFSEYCRYMESAHMVE